MRNDTFRLTMAQALVKFLDHQYVEREGVNRKFVQGILGIFGHGNVLGIGEALEQGVSTLRYIQGHNEQGMVHTAVAFAKHQRRRGIFACTTSIGPGALNMVTAAAVATVNRLPVLLLPGDTFSDRQPDPVLQQLEFPGDHTVTVNDAFKPVSVYWDRIMRAEQLLSSLPEAFAVLTDPVATGAVTLALPQDIQAAVYKYPAEWFQDHVWTIPQPQVEPGVLKQIVNLLKTKQRPVVISGGGVLYAHAEEVLAQFAQTFRIPVVETQAGKGALSWNHPWNVGGVGVTGSRQGNRLVREADLVLAVGTRLADFTTASKTLFQHPGVQIVGINVSRRDALKMQGIALIGDAKQALESLTIQLNQEAYKNWYPAEMVQDLRTGLDQDIAVLQRAHKGPTLHQTEALGVIHDVIGPEAIIVAAAGSLPGDLHRMWTCTQPHTYHVEYGFSCMGYEVAGALGVKWAEPTRDVYALVGDGSFLLMHSELVTSLQEGTKIVVIVFDNGGYGSINSLQRANGSQGFGTEFRARNQDGHLTGPRLMMDFAKMAEALGARGYSARTGEELQDALISAQTQTRSCVIDVKVGMNTGTDDSGAWWRVGVPGHSTSDAVNQAFLAMQEDLKKARW